MRVPPAEAGGFPRKEIGMRARRRTQRIATVLAALSPLLAASAAVPAQPGKAANRSVSAAAGTPRLWAARAAASYDALKHYLYLGAAGHHLFRETSPTPPWHNPYSFV